MRRALMLATTFATLSLAGCGGGEIVVHAHLDQEMDDGMIETMMLSELPVRLIPFDRDAIFDSVSMAYPEPEPEIPDSIFELREMVIEAQQEWRTAEAEWAALRDSLQAISNAMDGMDESSGEYFALFQEFNDVERRVNRLEEASSAEFEEFNELQQRLNTSSREITIARRNWADDAFASIDSIFLARYEQLGLEERRDTTNANGMAWFTGLESGQWWVNARYDRQFDELYWNVPVQVDGDSLMVELTEANAEVRQKM
jgi:hypothetical protein